MWILKTFNIYIVATPDEKVSWQHCSDVNKPIFSGSSIDSASALPQKFSLTFNSG